MNAILATDATLKTMSVTIQSLTVSGKQMTLAVFRQLPITRCYRDDGTLNPLRWWGKVRYGIKDQGELWAVAEHDGTLFRAEMFNPRYFSVPHTEKDIERLRKAYNSKHLDYQSDGGASERDRINKEMVRMFSENAEAIRRRENADKTWERLLTLPQLFIAV